MTTWVPLIPIVIVIVALLVLTFFWRRQGYTVGSGRTIVRCAQGHLFTTIWIPGGSFKAVRFGPFRLQRCPIGNHFTFVTPVRVDDLTDEERRFAEEHHDDWIP